MKHRSSTTRSGLARLGETSHLYHDGDDRANARQGRDDVQMDTETVGSGRAFFRDQLRNIGHGIEMVDPQEILFKLRAATD